MKKELLCTRCGHRWVPFVRKPKRCPVCKSVYWDKQYVRKPRRTRREA